MRFGAERLAAKRILRDEDPMGCKLCTKTYRTRNAPLDVEIFAPSQKGNQSSNQEKQYKFRANA
jgi:hypothetical protein